MYLQNFKVKRPTMLSYKVPTVNLYLFLVIFVQQHIWKPKESSSG
jgi:hypothetical protein